MHDNKFSFEDVFFIVFCKEGNNRQQITKLNTGYAKLLQTLTFLGSVLAIKK